METAPKPVSGNHWTARLKELGVFDEPGKSPAGLSGETARVHSILELARRIAKAVPLISSEVMVQDHNKYGYMAHNLSTILGFDNFSLAEYVYMQPDGHRPGLRLWLSRQGFSLQLVVILFPQIGEWQVDQAGRMLRTELVHLDLSGDVPKVLESVLEGIGPDTPWHEALAEAMCAPLW